MGFIYFIYIITSFYELISFKLNNKIQLIIILKNKKKMAFRNWIPTLVNYFSTMKDLDNQIEEIRTELCQNPNFIPRLLFDSIDLDQKNYITLNDFRLYLNNHFLPFEEKCLRRLIHNFDKDKNFFQFILKNFLV